MNQALVLHCCVMCLFQFIILPIKAAIGKMYEVQRTVVESEPNKFN